MDDSVPVVSIPSRDPGRRHTVPRPRARIQSRLDDNGRQGEEWEKSPIYKGEARRLRAGAPQKQLFHFPLDLREWSFQRPASWIDDDFALWTQLAKPEADGLADPTFDAIAHHGLPDGARQGEADLGTQAARPAREESGEQRT